MSISVVSGATTDVLTIDPISKAARTWLYDPAGNPITAITEGTDHLLGVAFRQDVHASALNSSAAAIANGAFFTGTGETSLGIGSIQVTTYIDRSHTVFVDQSADNANWYLTDSWPVPASFGIARSVTAMENYLRVRVRNDGASPSTVTAINTALCPVSETLPRSLTTGGNLKVTPTAEWQDNRAVTGLYVATTFRTLGSAATPQNLLTLENPAANLNNVVVRDCTIMSDSTVALATVAQQAILSKPAVLPTGGTVLVAVKYRTSYVNATAILRGATASDGGVATAITATPGTSIWQQFLDRPHTVVGWFTHPNYRMVPDVGADLRQLILAPGESILVQLVGNAPATTHMICNIAWTEYLAL